MNYINVHSASPSTLRGTREMVLAHNIATLSLTRSTANLWRRCLNTLWPSLPVKLATCRPSLDRIARDEGCQPPRVSTARGTNTMPSAAHHFQLSLYCCYSLDREELKQLDWLPSCHWTGSALPPKRCDWQSMLQEAGNTGANVNIPFACLLKTSNLLKRLFV